MLKRLAGFAFLPLLSAVSPFLLLPIIARIAGADGWASVAVGQAIGTFGAVLISFGWNLIGPTRVAKASLPERDDIYVASLLTRGAIAVLVLPLGGMAGWFLAQDSWELVGAAMAIALMLGGLSMSWFSIGSGEPRQIAIFEVTPRIAATAASVVLLLMTGEILWYPVLLGIATVAGCAAFSAPRLSIKRLRRVAREHSLESVRADVSTALTSSVAALYSSTPVVIVTAIAPVGAAALYASADKIYRLSLIVVVVLSNALTGWVSHPVLWSKMRMAVATHIVLGVIGGLLLWLLGPFASAVLFGEGLAAPPDVMGLLGVAFAAVSLNTSLGRHVLLPLAATRHLFASTVVGACVGVPAMIWLGSVEPTWGVAAGLAIGEFAVCCVQAVTCIAITRGRRARTAQAKY